MGLGAVTVALVVLVMEVIWAAEILVPGVVTAEVAIAGP